MIHDDPRWEQLRGGYGVPYDPRPALRRLLEHGESDEVWAELWNELHHQGDVGEASYAALTQLAGIKEQHPDMGWNLYALVGTIESERFRRTNPPIPDWLESGYRGALDVLLQFALADLASTSDPLMIQAALAIVALAKGELKLGYLLLELDESELLERLDERSGWSKLFDETR